MEVSHNLPAGRARAEPPRCREAWTAQHCLGGREACQLLILTIERAGQIGRRIRRESGRNDYGIESTMPPEGAGADEVPVRRRPRTGIEAKDSALPSQKRFPLNRLKLRGAPSLVRRKSFDESTLHGSGALSLVLTALGFYRV